MIKITYHILCIMF